MKYYKFSKRFILIRLLEPILIIMGALLLPFFFMALILYLLSILIKDFSADDSPLFVVVLFVIGAVLTIVMLVKTFPRKAGVYLYDGCMELRSGNYNFNMIFYSQIANVEYVGSFYRDRQAHYGKHAIFTSNYIGGKTNDCIKINFKTGFRHACCFVSVEDNEDLINELNKKISEYNT